MKTVDYVKTCTMETIRTFLPEHLQEVLERELNEEEKELFLIKADVDFKDYPWLKDARGPQHLQMSIADRQKIKDALEPHIGHVATAVVEAMLVNGLGVLVAEPGVFAKRCAEVGADNL